MNIFHCISSIVPVNELPKWPYDKKGSKRNQSSITAACKKTCQKLHNQVVNAEHHPNFQSTLTANALFPTCQQWTASGTYIVQKHMYTKYMERNECQQCATAKNILLLRSKLPQIPLDIIVGWLINLPFIKLGGEEMLVALFF